MRVIKKYLAWLAILWLAYMSLIPTLEFGPNCDQEYNRITLNPLPHHSIMPGELRPEFAEALSAWLTEHGTFNVRYNGAVYIRPFSIFDLFSDQDRGFYWHNLGMELFRDVHMAHSDWIDDRTLPDPALAMIQVTAHERLGIHPLDLDTSAIAGIAYRDPDDLLLTDRYFRWATAFRIEDLPPDTTTCGRPRRRSIADFVAARDALLADPPR